MRPLAQRAAFRTQITPGRIVTRTVTQLLAASLIALTILSTAWGQSASQARVARLSFVEGDVTVHRPDVEGWAQTPANTPIQGEFQVSTGDKSYAEIQFENGGTARLGELAILSISKLGVNPRGGEVNRVEFRQGYATFHTFTSPLGDSLQVVTSLGTVSASQDAQFRVDLDQDAVRVEVFQGAVQVQGSSGSRSIQTDSVLILQPGSTPPMVVSQGITKDDWDQWVDGRENRQQLSDSSLPPQNESDGADQAKYGMSDLQQYGTWSDIPGEGYGWSPSGVASDWAPYTAGQWCWYGGFGYTWIGTEPWGWLPYHYGGWDFIPGNGWVWFPGNLRHWSPSQVTWYRGPDWMGWIPRSHEKNNSAACGSNCGGGAVSTAAFNHGTVLTHDMMLGFSPETGQRVPAPSTSPTNAARLTGPSDALPAAHRHGPANSGFAVAQPEGSKQSNSSIVYDPQHGSYVNSYRVTPPQPDENSPGAGATHASSVPGRPSAGTVRIDPVPVSGREQNGLSTVNPPSYQSQPSSASRFARTAPSAPSSYAPAAHANPNPAGAAHPGSAPNIGHSYSPPPAGAGVAAGRH